ncbi:amino acid adenylation domain-containing protein, partial [Streptosporangium subroseum]|uniref:amino acid adenylation domain-containing protein n=1 Tax=Streptosporangium subroseum TaxID=106412 RepID=UPI00341576B4
MPAALAERIVACTAGLWNLYGPTETTIWSTRHEVTAGIAPSLGRPIANTVVYVLDKHLEPVPVGVPGELFIGGAGVARGYGGRPDLTAERFVADPFGPDGSRLYRTGDRARWRAGGELEYLGRIDQQVKIRGFRIEPGEVEAALLAHPAVAAAVVVAGEDASGRRLVGYLVPAEVTAGVPSAGELRAFLRETLPDYLVPGVFVELASIPLTPNGKIDRAALPAPEAAWTKASGSFAAPGSPTEEALAGVWAEVLGRERVGVGDGFFELGGHSLLATRVISRVREVFGVEVPLAALFDHPTVAGLAAVVDAATAASVPPIVPVPREERLPLSFAQQRLWFLDQLEPGSLEYNVPLTLRLEGPLDVAALGAALDAIVERHEVLRTRLVAVGGVPYQVVDPAAGFGLSVTDLSGEPDASARARELVAADAVTPFDLAAGPLFRGRLIRIGADDHVLSLCTHHVVSDKWSVGVLRGELSALYDVFGRGEPSPLTPLAVQYGDFAVWQRDRLRGDTLDGQLGCWRERLAGAPVLELPTDRSRPAVRTSAGDLVEFAVPATAVEALRELSRQSGATMFMTLLSAFTVLLGRYAGQDDVVVGTPIANRNRSEIEGLIGFFVNTLVLRTDLSGDPTFAELVGRVRREALGAYAHQDVPFEQVVDALAADRDRSRTPIFQVMFDYGHGEAGDGRPDLGGLGVADEGLPHDTALFDLTLALAEDGEGGLDGAFEFSVDLFDRPTVTRMAGNLLALLEAIAGNAERHLSEVAVLGAEEHRRVVEEWNDTAVPAVTTAVYESITAQAAARPEAIALEADGRSLTYAELDARANRLANHLRGIGVGPEIVVGLCVERGPDMVVAALAVWKAGGAYLPLDPDHPAERLGYMLADSGAGLLVAHRAAAGDLVEQVALAGGRTLWLDDPGTAATLDAASPVAPAAPVDGAGRLAYVIYTSGSTGRPKGVMVAHDGLANVMSAMASQPGVDAGDTVLAVTTLGFDIAGLELFLPLTRGARVVVASHETARSPEALAAEIERHGVTVMQATPATWQMLLDAGWRGSAGLRVWCGGEALPASLADGIGARCAALWNLYGPTETTIWSSRQAVSPGSRVSLGRPIANTTMYVLDRCLQPLPVGVPGELFIGGAGVARGYAGRPELTAERFVPNPFAADGSRLYRTGDRARWGIGGELEFLGRVDDQVKVNGFRIEPGEVEAALRAHPTVAHAVVVARDDDGYRRLVAYLVPADMIAGMPPAAELRGFLRAGLPDYLVPAVFVELAAVPLTPNGKVDRAALPAPEGGRPEPGGEPVSARTATEEVLAGIWAQVLGLSQVGVTDGFFDLGGHSLLATQVISRLRAAFDVEVPLAALFDHPTVAGLARMVDEAVRGSSVPPIVPVSREGFVPLSFAQQRLWFLDQLEPGSAEYNVPIALRLEGRLEVVALGAALDAVVERHEVLRTRLVSEGGVAYQIVDPPSGFGLEVIELSGESDPLLRAEGLAAADAVAPFDLAAGPLFRGRLLRLGADDHVLSLTLHHIVADEWSAEVLRRELAALYGAFSRGEPSPLAPLAVQYADFAVWQRDWLRGEVLEGQLGYWRGRLEGAQVLELPTDRPRPAVRSTAGAAIEFEISERTVTGLRELSRQSGATMFMTLLSAFTVLLGRYAGQDDVVVGTPIANRNRSEIEGLIGFFVNTLVLRTDLSGDPTFAELVGRVRREALGAYAHQDVPFEQVVDALELERDRSRTPLFQVLFDYGQNGGTGPDLGGAHGDPAVSGLGVARETTLFDLSLVLVEDGDRLAGVVEYSTDLFERSTVERMLGHLTALLEAVSADAGGRVSELSLLGTEERRQLVSGWNDTETPAPDASGVHELIAERVVEHPEAVAVMSGETSLTYAELDVRANRLAHHLRALGVGPETVVGLCLPRDADLVVALLAVWKAGGAYLPLDPDYPAERVAYMVADGGAPVIIATRASAEALSHGDARVVYLDDPATSAAVQTRSPSAPTELCGPDRLAGVIYTSGSTGRPKGVLVTHGSLVGVYGAWARSYFPADARYRWLSVTSVSFDVFTGDVVRALCSGGALVLERVGLQASAPELAEVLARYGVNAFESAPRFVDQLVAHVERTGERLESLRLLVVTTDVWRTSGVVRAREVLGSRVRLLTA